MSNDWMGIGSKTQWLSRCFVRKNWYQITFLEFWAFRSVKTLHICAMSTHAIFTIWLPTIWILPIISINLSESQTMDKKLQRLICFAPKDDVLPWEFLSSCFWQRLINSTAWAGYVFFRRFSFFWPKQILAILFGFLRFCDGHCHQNQKKFYKYFLVWEIMFLNISQITF